jgi:hypothetical protein
MTPFSFSIFSGTSAPLEVYDVWKSVWTKTLRDLDGAERLYSDDFTKQDEIIVLYFESKPVALVCHRFVDISLQMNQDDSYFKPWPKKAILSLQKDGNNIAIGSQITILPDFRKTVWDGIPLKELITALSLDTLRAKPIDAITGVMRADKGMNDLFFRCGATALLKNVTFHNVPVDLVAFFPKTKAITIDTVFSTFIETMKNNESRAA